MLRNIPVIRQFSLHRRSKIVNVEVETRLRSQQTRNLRFRLDDVNPVEEFLRMNEIENVKQRR